MLRFPTPRPTYKNPPQSKKKNDFSSFQVFPILICSIVISNSDSLEISANVTHGREDMPNQSSLGVEESFCLCKMIFCDINNFKVPSPASAHG